MKMIQQNDSRASSGAIIDFSDGLQVSLFGLD